MRARRQRVRVVAAFHRGTYDAWGSGFGWLGSQCRLPGLETIDVLYGLHRVIELGNGVPRRDFRADMWKPVTRSPSVTVSFFPTACKHRARGGCSLSTKTN